MVICGCSEGEGCFARRAWQNGDNYPRSARTMVLPRAAGLSATWMPAARIASILAPAVSRPPEMTAPA